MLRTPLAQVARRFQLRGFSALAPSLDPNRLLSAPEARITTLPSGLRVATELRHGETASVGVWIDGKLYVQYIQSICQPMYMWFQIEIYYLIIY